MGDTEGSEQERIGAPDRGKYWSGRIEKDQKTLTPQEIAKKYGGIIAEHERLRFIDPSTGLWTLRGLRRQIGYEIARSRRDNTQLAVYMFDLDGFKQINEQRGHEEGNRAIKAMADFLAEETQETGVVGRYGGDEFSLVCPNTDLEKAKIIADTIRFKLKYHMRRLRFDVTSSVGLTALRADNQNVLQLLNEADQALKQAKLEGKDTVVTFDPEKMTQKAA